MILHRNSVTKNKNGNGLVTNDDVYPKLKLRRNVRLTKRIQKSRLSSHLKLPKLNFLLVLNFFCVSSSELVNTKLRERSKRVKVFLRFLIRILVARSLLMADEKSTVQMPSRDRELLIPVADSIRDDSSKASSSSSSSSSQHAGRETFYKIVQSWASKKFMTGCVILFPIAITFYITWWFIHFVDGFFSPIYAQLGINIFGLGFVTSITFIFLVGVFMSSWLGASVLGLGEWFIKRMPFVRHIYNASKQISSAISPDQNTQAFKEVAIIRHPRVGEYAFGFITSSVTLQSYSSEEELCCVFVPTNHLYIGDIFLINTKDVFRLNLSVREGIEIVISGGMSMPQILSTLDTHSERSREADRRLQL